MTTAEKKMRRNERQMRGRVRREREESRDRWVSYKRANATCHQAPPPPAWAGGGGGEGEGGGGVRQAAASPSLGRHASCNSEREVGRLCQLVSHFYKPYLSNFLICACDKHLISLWDLISPQGYFSTYCEIFSNISMHFWKKPFTFGNMFAYIANILQFFVVFLHKLPIFAAFIPSFQLCHFSLFSFSFLFFFFLFSVLLFCSYSPFISFFPFFLFLLSSFIVFPLNFISPLFPLLHFFHSSFSILYFTPVRKLCNGQLEILHCIIGIHGRLMITNRFALEGEEITWPKKEIKMHL